MSSQITNTNQNTNQKNLLLIINKLESVLPVGKVD